MVKDLLHQCLNSIFSCIKNRTLEVIVVDNASTDGSVEMIRREFPQVKLIVNNENLGFAKACNQGIRQSQGKYLLFLNPDTEVVNDIRGKIVNFMEVHTEVGVGGCHLYYPDGRAQTSFYRFTTLKTLIGRAFLLYSFLPRNSLTAPLFFDYLRQNEPVERVCGGGMVVRKKALEQVGLFDDSFFLYYEDEDLCYRSKQQVNRTYT